MRRTEAALDQGLESRVAALEQRDREWRPWLALLRETFHALEDGGWDEPIVGSQAPVVSSRSDGAPLLQGVEMRLDVDRAQALFARLAAVVGLESSVPSAEQTLRLIADAAQQGQTGLEAEGDRIHLVARLVTWPLLLACGRMLADVIPASWAHGHCPVCGAWPLVAELRGLERARRLRCGRCAADWALPWLTCAYCGERDHAQLGSLVPDADLDARKVETCSTCRGYLKSVSTLGALRPAELPLVDLETLELDLVARERGWERPPQPVLDVRVRSRS